MKSFTYIIRSSSGTLTEGIGTNDLTIRMNGLPTTKSHFYCEVADFFVTTSDSIATIIELRQEGMNLINGCDTLWNELKTVAFTNTNNTFPQSVYAFKCENFNNKDVRFQLYDEKNVLMTNKAGNASMSKPWVLVLKITPID